MKNKKDLMDEWAPNLWLVGLSVILWFASTFNSPIIVEGITGFSLVILSWAFFLAKRRKKHGLAKK
jgi:uncharacterized membrane protein